MYIWPGDIALVTDIVFENGEKDKSKYGRPCFVLFADNTNVHLLTMSTKMEWLHLYNDLNRYTILDVTAQDGIVHLGYVYKTPRANIRRIVHSAGSDYFRVAKLFRDFNQNSNCYYVHCCVKRVTKLEDNRNELEKKLVLRYKDFCLEKLMRKKEARSSCEIVDPIEKGLKRKQLVKYKREKNC